MTSANSLRIFRSVATRNVPALFWGLLALTGAVLLRADEEVGGRITVIRAGKVITVSGKTYQPGMVVLEDNKVRLVGASVEYPKSARVIDARQETVMPGLVLPRTRYQLPSYSRGGVQAARRATDEIIPSEIEFERFLQYGYTTIGFIPSGTGIPGAASAYRSGGADDQLLEADSAYLRVSMSNPSSDRRTLSSALKKAKAAIEKVKKAREKWTKQQQEEKKKAEETKKKPQKPPAPKPVATPPKKPAPPKRPQQTKEAPKKFEPPKVDPNIQPFVDLLEGKTAIPIVFELGQASDLRHLEQELKGYPQITGNFFLRLGFYVDYHHIVEDLGQREALVILEPRTKLLSYTVNRVNLAADLSDSGATIAFIPSFDSTSAFRNVRIQVADLVRSGLSRATALRALTVNAARVLGLEETIGTIEKGKRADLLFLDGDPLDPHSAPVRVMIDGEIVWRRKS